MKRIASSALAFLLLVSLTGLNAQQPRLAADAAAAAGTSTSAAVLGPTDHPRVPHDLAQLWLAPQQAAARGAAASVVDAINLQEKNSYDKSLAVLATSAAQQGPLGEYATYYAGVAQLHLGRPADARRTFHSLGERSPVGYLTEAGAFGEAEADETLNEPRAAVDIYERLLASKVGLPDDTLLRLGKAAKAAGDTAKASDALARLYYDFPLSDLAPAAGGELTRLGYLTPIAAGNERYKRELKRAGQLFAAKQYSAARGAYDALRPSADGDDRELVGLRIAECDYFLKHARIARDELRPYLSSPSRAGEALFFSGLAASDVGDKSEFVKTMRQVASGFENQPWAADALDHLATYQIVQNDDEAADATLRQLYEKYPRSQFSERAAWKIGWHSYRQQQYEDTARVFERAAADFPRSDYRPSWLYWSGRAREQMGDRATAQQRYLLTATDYLNSYYGRLASARLDGLTPVARVTAAVGAQREDQLKLVPPPPPNGAVVRRLLEYRLYAQALNELRFAARAWGDSPAIEATTAWIHQQQGQSETGARRFTLVRGSITTMRRAYPQFLAAGGEELPREILSVIFPLGYWDLIRKYSTERDLDPYLVAALVAQESTFVPDIKSYASAVGLMQLMSFTGRGMAKKLGIRYSPAALTNPETNVRLGTAYLADKIKEFGDVHLALASYNAGESAVHRWLSERADVPRDEFIDDIPYPQTQNYVKRILGTAEDYRRLYGSVSHVEELAPAARLASVAQGVGAPPKSTGSKPAAKTPAKKTAAKKKSRNVA